MCPGRFTRVWTGRDFCNSTVSLNQSITASLYTLGASTCASVWPRQAAAGASVTITVADPCLFQGLSIRQMLALQLVCRFAPSRFLVLGSLIVAYNTPTDADAPITDALILSQSVIVGCQSPSALSSGSYYVELSVDGGSL